MAEEAEASALIGAVGNDLDSMLEAVDKELRESVRNFFVQQRIDSPVKFLELSQEDLNEAFRSAGPKPRAQGPKPRAQGPGPKAQGPGPRAQGPKPKAQGPGPRAQGGGTGRMPFK